VHNGKVAEIIGRKIRSKDAILRATASQELAGSTRRRITTHFKIQDSMLTTPEAKCFWFFLNPNLYVQEINVTCNMFIMML